MKYIILTFLCFFLGPLVWSQTVLDVESPGFLLPPPQSIVASEAKKSLYLIQRTRTFWVMGYVNDDNEISFYKYLVTPTTHYDMERIPKTCKIRVRSPIVLTPYSYTIAPQKDLKIVSERADDYQVLVPFGTYKEKFLVNVPKRAKIKLYNTTSSERYVDAQRKKGLIYYKKKWITQKEYQLILKKKEKRILLEKEVLNEHSQTAPCGFLFLYNGQFVEGEYHKTTGGYLLFSARDSDVKMVLKPTQLKIDSAVAMIPRGTLYVSQKYEQKFFDALEQRSYVQAYQALNILEHYTQTIPDSYNREIILLYKKLRHRWDFVMHTHNLAIYQNTVIDSDFLKANLDSGKILFESVWIYPSQKCKRCHAKGSIDCPGTVLVACLSCDKGYSRCSICRGSGQVPCKKCKERGYARIRCKSCSGSGQRWHAEVTSPKVVVMTNGARVGHSGVSYGYWETCSSCDGAGVTLEPCSVCKGACSLPCPSKVECRKCKGSGQVNRACPLCNGTESRICPDCNGKKFLELL